MSSRTARFVRCGCLSRACSRQALQTTAPLLMVEESLTLSSLPSGYRALCHSLHGAADGRHSKLPARCNDLWSGLVEWLYEQKLDDDIPAQIPF
ncbi:MAG: kanamycin nucleotidyltransferase C-terminal domain-containing protein [Gemmatimonadales bacterium]